eukprot:m.265488 g.265488  ORF g.265488 m.265488 type:complete len:286 (+) comp54681_c0_seq1:2387-3244(+)
MRAHCLRKWSIRNSIAISHCRHGRLQRRACLSVAHRVTILHQSSPLQLVFLFLAVRLFSAKPFLAFGAAQPFASSSSSVSGSTIGIIVGVVVGVILLIIILVLVVRSQRRNPKPPPKTAAPTEPDAVPQVVVASEKPVATVQAPPTRLPPPPVVIVAKRESTDSSAPRPLRAPPVADEDLSPSPRRLDSSIQREADTDDPSAAEISDAEMGRRILDGDFGGISEDGSPLPVRKATIHTRVGADVQDAEIAQILEEFSGPQAAARAREAEMARRILDGDFEGLDHE